MNTQCGQFTGAVYELRDHLLPHLEEEEKIIFPYIKQIAHAYENHEPYAALLVRTLRKPVENVTNRNISVNLYVV
jgi:iron-sulfur cluster repair protein YtfE (RIC family)